MNFNVVLCNGWSDIKELAWSISFIDERMNMMLPMDGLVDFIDGVVSFVQCH